MHIFSFKPFLNNHKQKKQVQFSSRTIKSQHLNFFKRNLIHLVDEIKYIYFTHEIIYRLSNAGSSIWFTWSRAFTGYLWHCFHLYARFDFYLHSYIISRISGVTYCFSVSRGDVDPVFPYISASGNTRPESCLFSLLLNFCAFLSFLLVYLR